MRLLQFIACSLPLLLPAPASAQTFEVTTEADDLTGARTIESQSLRPLSTDAYPGAHASFRAIHEDRPDAPNLWSIELFGYTSDTTDVGRSSRVRIQADDTSYVPRQVGSRIRLIDEQLVELKRIVVSRNLFEEMARADTVVLSIGDVEFPMTHTIRTDMRLILEEASTTPSAPSQRASESNPDSTSSSKSSG